MSSGSETTPQPQFRSPLPEPSPCQLPKSAQGPQPTSRFFLDAFAGVHAPLSQAASNANLDRYEPLDIITNPAHDILNDSVFESLLRLCWSGAIGLIACAPPCKEYSRLKMRPGGPPALRTPAHMDGVPGLSPTQLKKVRESREIHQRGRALLHAVMCKGGIGVLEQPPSSLAWLEQANLDLFKEFQGHLAWVDACRHGKDWAKSWCFASNSARIGRLAALCNHNIEHQSIAGVKDASGEYLSTTTAEYPATLAKEIIDSVSYRVTRHSSHPRPLPLGQPTIPSLPVGPRLKMCDGAGNYSSADHSIPANHLMPTKIAHAWLHWAAQGDLDTKIMAHVMRAAPEPPLSPQEVHQAIQVLYETIGQPQPSSLDPEADQPYRLKLLATLGALTGDPDMALLPHLERGVPTGIFDPIPSSHQWPPASEHKESEALTQLDLCMGNWKAAEDHPQEVEALIHKEIEQGWVERTNMSLEEAKAFWPKGVALGKLNVVFADGKDPRLVLDSTICGVNPRCHIPERVTLPMAADLRLATQPQDSHGAFIGASLDFKAAHKQVKIRPEERGLLLFSHREVLYHYKVCHFGARFSAYWWQRVGAFLMRHIHSLLSFMPHKAWLYVDDILAALWKAQAREGLALMVIFMQVINAPISWKKAQCEACIQWCGWEINFDHDTIKLSQNKISKLVQLIGEILQKPKVCRKLLERTIGLMVWASSISLHLRPHLAPLYADLYSPPGSQYAVPAPLWQTFRSALSNDLQLPACPSGLFIPPGARILEYKGRRLHCKSDLPEIPATAKVQFVRASNPEASHTRLRRESVESLKWFAATISQSPQRPLAMPSTLQCLAAADACAEDAKVGIGGWVITPTAVAWFAEMWDISELRKPWPFLTKPAQAYIASFETLAQFALLQSTYHVSGHSHLQIQVPSGTDNTATEAGLNKLFTTKWPLCHFLRLIASWSHAHGIALMPSHIPGTKNVWADDLSRDNLKRFAHRRRERLRFSPDSLARSGKCLTLYPPDARWREEHIAAANQ